MSQKIEPKQNIDIKYVTINKQISKLALITPTKFQIFLINQLTLKLYYQQKTDQQLNKILFIDQTEQIITILNLQKTSRMNIWNIRQKKMISSSEMKFLITTAFCKMNLIGLSSPKNSTLKLIYKDQCYQNQKGIITISQNSQNIIVAYPQNKQGYANIFSITKSIRYQPIKAHKTKITNIVLSSNGKRVATTSHKGTVLRIFNIQTRDMIQQVRISTQRCSILNISFSPLSTWIACINYKGQISIFSAKRTNNEMQEDSIIQLYNPRSSFAFLSYFFSYFNEEKQFADFKIQENLDYLHDRIVFNTQHKFYLLNSNKVIFMKFDPIHGGKCQQNGIIKLKEL